MAAERPNVTPLGRLRHNAPAGRNSPSPLTPRLAANTSSTSRDPSPRRPFVKATSTSRNPSPEKRETPVRALTSDRLTPRSSARAPVPRPGSTVSTPGSATPGSARAGATVVTPRLATSQTSTERDVRNAARARVAQDTPVRRDYPPLSPLSQDSAVLSSSSIDDVSGRANAMFFHASDAKSQTPTSTNPVAAPPKRAGFFYANGQQEGPSASRPGRPASPALSMLTDQRPFLNTRTVAASEIGQGPRQRVISPSLSIAGHARSPFAISPLSEVRSLSPTKTDYLNTPSATINHQRLRGRHVESTPVTPVADALGVTYDLQPRPMHNMSPRGHNKSMSICAIPTESPGSARKRSATWTELKMDESPSHTRGIRAPDHSPPASPITSRMNQPAGLTSPIISDPTQSPSKELIDYAADARRERKVLDLEISNSSLLAINRTLEREVKKHKVELKRYRRLSRAGRFSVMPGSSSLDDLEGGEGSLPHIDGAFVGRPSSPFEEDVSDMDLSNEGSTSEEDEEDEGKLTPGAQATKEQRRRAKDEAQLRNDLRKHRELLLDTARMNRSLQRCLTWTEDLIRDGKKALVHKVKSDEVKLGGRVLDEDDAQHGVEDGDGLALDGDASGGALGVADGEEEEGEEEEEDDDGLAVDSAGADDYTGVEAFLGIGGPWHRPTQPAQQQHKHRREPSPERNRTSAEGSSAGSESTNRDSGVEIEKLSGQRHAPSSAAPLRD